MAGASIKWDSKGQEQLQLHNQTNKKYNVNSGHIAV